MVRPQVVWLAPLLGLTVTMLCFFAIFLKVVVWTPLRLTATCINEQSVNAFNADVLLIAGTGQRCPSDTEQVYWNVKSSADLGFFTRESEGITVELRIPKSPVLVAGCGTNQLSTAWKDGGSGPHSVPVGWSGWSGATVICDSSSTSSSHSL